MPRTSHVKRSTRETQIELRLDLDAPGNSTIHTAVGFFDHMLDLLAKHANISLAVSATGDLHIDAHHTVEDVGLALGQALLEALGDKSGITRFGHASVPMDESLASCAIDLSGRPAFVFNVPFSSPMIGTFPSELVEEFFKSLANAGKLNLHLNAPYGTNNHHLSEACFKAFARALRSAIAVDPFASGVPSTKGSLIV